MSLTPGSWPYVLHNLEQGLDLTVPDAQWAMREILEGRANDEEISAFLLLLRAKGETAAEVNALVDEMYVHCAPISITERAVDTVGTGGDVAHTINISTTSAIIAAAAGARVVKHGNRAATSRSGSADLLEALGVAITLDGPAIETCVRELGIGFCFAPKFHPAMRFAGPARKALGVPSVFNILGPLANPARPKAAAIGVADQRLHHVMAEVLTRRGVDGFVFRGDDGLDEITLTTTSTVLVIGEGKVKEIKVDPRDFEIPYSPMSELIGGDATENARITLAIFAGEHGTPRDAVVINSAAAIAAFRGELDRSPVERLNEGVVAAIEAIDSGAASQLLARWVALSQKLATT
ncbi:MAG: anthranilate phosphoribosyltransferase [Candidatus Nanopelagicaceae bacterium]|jgi:anthranilate phosphoribosyltransferase